MTPLPRPQLPATNSICYVAVNTTIILYFLEYYKCLFDEIYTPYIHRFKFDVLNTNPYKIQYIRRELASI
jgi:hypothetical protein